MFRKPGRSQEDFSDEVQSHIQLEADRLVEEGMGRKQALLAARRTFGNIAGSRERFYESTRWMWLEHLGRDVRYALRGFWKHKSATAVALLSLTLGIGVNTTIFSVIDSVGNQPLRFDDPDRLAVISATNPERGITRRNLSFEQVSALLEQDRSFEQIGYMQYGTEQVTLSGSDEAAQQVPMLPVDVRIFSVLGVQPLLGRTFVPEDAQDLIKQKEIRSIVVSHAAWQTYLGGSVDVIGQSLRIDGAERPVIGVMPPNFAIVPWAPDVTFWAANDLSQIPKATWLTPIGRLKPGVTADQARADVEIVTRQLIEGRGEQAAGWGALVRPLDEAYFGDTLSTLWFLQGAVAFVLLIACTNVANLLMAQGTTRKKELTLRVAVGAGRGRLVRQLLTESVVLAVAGGTLGVVLAFGGNRLFGILVPDEMSDLLVGIHVSGQVLAFTLGVSLATGILFGLIPALQTSKLNLSETLKEGGRESSVVSSGRGRSLLLLSEVSLAMILLIGAGLMMKGFLNELNAPQGFNSENLLTADVLLAGSKYFQKTPSDMSRVTPQCALFYERAVESIEEIPGVVSAATVSRLPIQGQNALPFAVLGKPAPVLGEEPTADYNEVTPRLFETLGVPLLRGRAITDRDLEGSPWVAVINQAMADRHFPGEDPIGQAIRITVRAWAAGIDVPEEQAREIVGIIPNLKYPAYVDPPPAAVYISHRQRPSEYPGIHYYSHINRSLLVRTSVPPMSLAEPIRKAVQKIDRDQSVNNLMTMERRISDSNTVVSGRFFARIFTLFGLLAVTLAMVGIYGVMSRFVNQMRHEFGVRIALGADKREMARLVLRQLLRPAALGVAIGILGGVWLVRVLSSRFVGLTSIEPGIVAAVTALMIAAALLAAYVPARRATRVDPIATLRCD